MFLFADDLNSATTEEEIKQLLFTSNTCQSFYPSNAQWISCKNYTYIPHSNECGPRSLIAATIMALHPNPSELILLPTRHPNLAQIARTWVAKSLLTNQIDHSALLPLLAPHHQVPLSVSNAPSQPFHLIPWPSRDSTVQPLQNSVKISDINTIKGLVLPKSFSSKLNPCAPEFLSKEVKAEGSKPPKWTARNRTKLKPRYSVPTKRKGTVLPGHHLLSSFFPKTAQISAQQPQEL
jgi:hypothetical protein